eukprot:3598283-Alexandrium_andersonii.AAC.1
MKAPKRTKEMPPDDTGARKRIRKKADTAEDDRWRLIGAADCGAAGLAGGADLADCGLADRIGADSIGGLRSADPAVGVTDCARIR